MMTLDKYIIIRPLVETFQKSYLGSSIPFFIIESSDEYEVYIELTNDFANFPKSEKVLIDKKSSLFRSPPIHTKKTSQNNCVGYYPFNPESEKNKRNIPQELSDKWKALGKYFKIYYRAFLKPDQEGKINFSTPIGKTSPFIHGHSPKIDLLYSTSKGINANMDISLRVEGNKIIRKGDKNKEPVILRGVNISGLQYRSWFFGKPGNKRPVSKDISWLEAAGIYKYQIDEIKIWGANIIRITLNQDWALNGLANPVNNERKDSLSYLEDIDEIINWATAENPIYVLLCLHTMSLEEPVSLVVASVNNDGIKASELDNPCLKQIPKEQTQEEKKLNEYIKRKPYDGHMPDNNSLLFWSVLAKRYHANPYVLYDLFNEPHRVDYKIRYHLHGKEEEPELYNDPYKDYYTGIVPEVSENYEKPNGWSKLWHYWVRNIEEIIHTINKNAILFVSGFDGPVLSMSLRSMPVKKLPSNKFNSVLLNESDFSKEALENIVYCSHIYWEDWDGDANKVYNSKDEKAWRFWLNMTEDENSFSNKYPIFIAEWGIKTEKAIGLCKDYGINNTCTAYDDKCKQYTIEEWWFQIKQGKKGILPGDEKLNDTYLLSWGNNLLKFINSNYPYERKDSKNIAQTYWGLAGWAAWSYSGKPFIIMRKDPVNDGEVLENNNIKTFPVDGESPFSPKDLPSDYGEIIIKELLKIKQKKKKAI